MENPGPVHGISGDRIPHLEYLADSRSLAVLRLLQTEVDAEGQDELLRLIGRYFGLPGVMIFLTPVRSATEPYAVGVDQNRRPWKKSGDLYSMAHVGTMINGSWCPAPKGEEDAVWIWLCLAAAA